MRFLYREAQKGKPTMTHDFEEWRSIEGYDGFYEVSSLGRVRSLPRIIKKSDGTEQPVKGRILSQNKTGKTENPKYYAAQIGKNGKSRAMKVHILVAQAFLGKRPDNLVVNHINGDSFDNRPENLEYITNRENISHASKGKYVGVSYYKKTNKWRASMSINGKHTSLGLHNTPEEAAEAYKAALEKQLEE